MTISENRVGKEFGRFLKDQNGATAIEYSLIAVGIAVAIVGSVSLLGTNLSNSYNDVGNAISN